MIIGTRGSALALAQTRKVLERLRLAWPDEVFEERIVQTAGDRKPDSPLIEIGQKGAFVRELEIALRHGEIDAAVHSLKDVPCVLDDEFCLAAVPEREDPRDCLVSPSFGSLSDLPRMATVGTGSPRRKAMLLRVRPDLRVQDIRGNVDTRIGKVRAGAFDAIVLAVAGIARLGLSGQITEIFSWDVMMPAPGQGALGLECRTDDVNTHEKLAAIDAPSIHACVEAERAVAAKLGASCHTALGTLAIESDGRIKLRATLAQQEGLEVLCEQGLGTLNEATALGYSVAERLLARGGNRFLL